jgi:hypothetical protein
MKGWSRASVTVAADRILGTSIKRIGLHRQDYQADVQFGRYVGGSLHSQSVFDIVPWRSSRVQLARHAKDLSSSLPCIDASLGSCLTLRKRCCRRRACQGEAARWTKAVNLLCTHACFPSEQPGDTTAVWDAQVSLGRCPWRDILERWPRAHAGGAENSNMAARAWPSKPWVVLSSIDRTAPAAMSSRSSRDIHFFVPQLLSSGRLAEGRWGSRGAARADVGRLGRRISVPSDLGRDGGAFALAASASRGAGSAPVPSFPPKDVPPVQGAGHWLPTALADRLNRTFAGCHIDAAIAGRCYRERTRRARVRSV